MSNTIDIRLEEFMSTSVDTLLKDRRVSGFTIEEFAISILLIV